MRSILVLAGVVLLACMPAAAETGLKADGFIQIESVTELDQALQNLEGKPALLKVSSKWDVPGAEMDKHFASEIFRHLLLDVVLLDFDISDNTEDDREFLARYGISGTPWILFFDANGKHLADQDVAGYRGAKALAEHIADVFED